MTDSNQKLEALLDRLSTDDAFREQMINDPVAAFASLGIKVDPSKIPDARALPSKEQLAAERDRIHAQLDDEKVCLILFAANPVDR